MSTPFEDAAEGVREGRDPHDAAADLVGDMTLAEKLDCLDGDTPFWPGLFNMTSGGYYQHTWPAAQVERLGIPGIAFADGPRGCVVGDATAFPVSMARGATFDPDLEERIGAAIGRELSASGATYTGAVCMNLLRHPAWGRAQETYGEDPLHVGAMAAALTRGLQRHVMACMKHFALNSMENARFKVDVTADERALHEVYLPHFKRVAAEGVASVMSAYNSVNGEWCGENSTLLTDILREEWGWDGFVTSDFIFGLRDPAKSLRAGLDIEMPFRQQRAMRLADALDDGEVSESDVDAAVERVVATLLRFAFVFESPPPITVVGCDEHRSLAREAAVASTVLLRNEGNLLPVDQASINRVAVLGRLAAMRNLGDGGSSDVKASRVVTPLDGLRAKFGSEAVTFSADDASIASGADLVVVIVGYTKDDEGEYISDAGTAPLIAEMFPPMDHATLGVDAPYEPQLPPGHSEDLEAEHEVVSENLGTMAPGGDRTSLLLSDADESLIAAASALSANVVVVVVSGSSVVMPWADSVPVVLLTWYSGVEGGTALADVLTGAVEPAGRLPFVITREAAHLPEFDKDAETASYGLFHGQWKLDRDVQRAHYPFGWG
ncbi:MAG: glycoside hydrolase family 3 protein, partial [Actinobacteria bacterium]|nr:glycoside hydrolase family 3 protein [Actinomycetota bacterium]